MQTTKHLTKYYKIIQRRTKDMPQSVEDFGASINIKRNSIKLSRERELPLFCRILQKVRSTG